MTKKKSTDHIVVLPSQKHLHMYCEYCGREERHPFPIKALEISKVTKEFVKANSMCPVPVRDPRKLKLETLVRAYALMNPRQELAGEGRIRAILRMNKESPLMVYIEGMRGPYHPAAIEIIEEPSTGFIPLDEELEKKETT